MKFSYQDSEKKLKAVRQKRDSMALSDGDNIQKNRRFLQKAQEIGLIGTWELDIPNKKLFWTDETYKIFGIPVGTELTYEIFMNCIHPGDRRFVDDEWKSAMAGKPYDIEHRILAQGKTKWIREKAEFYCNEQGVPITATGVAQDITEKKSVETALSNSEKKFRLAFDTSPDSINLNRLSDGMYLDINQGFTEILGYSVEDVRGKTSIDLNIWKNPDDRTRLAEGLRESGFVQNLEAEFIGKDGRIRDGLMSARLTTINGEKVIISITRDITERKKLESERQVHARNLETIFDSAPFILAICDKELRIKMINRKGAGLVRKPKEALSEKFCGDVFHCQHSFYGKGCGENPQCPSCRLRNSVLSTFETRNSNFETETKMTLIIDGIETVMDFSISTEPLLFDNEERVLLSMTDITESKMNEQALLESEEKYRTMMEVQEDPTYIASSDMRIEYMNPAMIKWVGKDAVGSKCHEAIWKNKTKCTWCLFDKIMKGETAAKELLVPGSEEIFHVSSAPIRHPDGSISKFTSYRNVTEVKKLYTRLRQAQKMEAIGNLAGGIAHDFNNILFPIVGMSEMMMEDFPVGSPEHENANEILTAGRRGAELVNQILAFSRQNENELSPTRLQFVMKEVLKLSRASIPANIEINQFLQPDCGLILADSTQLHQIGMNLITNAYHAVQEKNGKIIVEVREIEIKKDAGNVGLPSGRYATLTVADNGTGIEQQHLEKIFEPYFTTKENGKGTGLGLSVVYGIVKRCKGDIRVKSEIGRGTSFQIYLPIMALSSSLHAEINNTLLPEGTETILLVDDELPIANLEKKILESLGYSVSKRVSSIDALDAFKATPDSYDLIISDMSMPQLTGEQLALEILEIRPDIPIIICTGFSERISKKQAFEMGIKGFLMKPVVKADLANEIRRVLDENQSGLNV